MKRAAYPHPFDPAADIALALATSLLMAAAKRKTRAPTESELAAAAKRHEREAWNRAVEERKVAKKITKELS